VILKNATKVKVVKEFNHFIRIKIANFTIIRAVDPAFDGLDGVLLNFGGDEAFDVTDSVVTIAAVSQSSSDEKGQNKEFSKFSKID